MKPCNQAKHVEIFQCKQHEVHQHSPKFLLNRRWGIVWGPFDELRTLLRIWGQIEDLLRIFWGPIEDLRIFNGIAHPYLLNAPITIRIYLKPLFLFENQQSILHLYRKQTLFSFWISSESVCLVHQQAHYSTRFSNKAFSLRRLLFIQGPCLPFPGCLWVPTHPGPSAFHHHTHVFPPSFHCLCSRYRVALLVSCCSCSRLCGPVYLSWEFTNHLVYIHRLIYWAHPDMRCLHVKEVSTNNTNACIHGYLRVQQCLYFAG